MGPRVVMRLDIQVVIAPVIFGCNELSGHNFEPRQCYLQGR
jgi:hypothetical protein